ncbi:uncharacterized protein LOC125372774 [Haliotis rufescens]|uniref:uncharacterized protein LOC125372774 n=1 Tax=Haliotis rufescens TaxID=6454 RepID=UPI00201EF540|nr:uncharacterized protein LOC125372774 [Haliotis rufescens]
MLHVISVQYQNMTPSCESPPGASCVFLQETQADSLYTDCNGVATCQMEVQKFWMDTVCGDTATYHAVISYECVSADPVKICNNVNVNVAATDADVTAFLVSPGYPRGLTSAANTCICDVTGSDMNVTILEYYIYPVASMSLTGDNETWDSVTAGSLTYNTLVLENSMRLGVMFDGNQPPGKARRGVWMKVQGSTTLTLTCNDGPSPVLSSTRLTQDSPATTSATSRRPLQEVTECRDSERTLTLVSSVCGVAIIILLVAIVAIIVYFKAIKPSRNTAVVPDQREEPTYSQLGHVGQSGDHTESARPYSGLMDTTYSTVFCTEQSLVACSDHVHYTSIQDVHGHAKVNINT